MNLLNFLLFLNNELNAMQLSNLSIIARVRMLEEQKPEAVTEATRLELNGVEANEIERYKQ